MDTVDQAIKDWQPMGKFLFHCSNCYHGKVTGSGTDIKMYCDKNYGSDRHILQLIRQKNPRGWRNALACPDFDNMSNVTFESHRNGTNK